MPQCRFAKSDMTPCVRKDGPVAFCFGPGDEPICVGCERSPDAVNVRRPDDWDQQVAAYRNQKRGRK